MSRNGQAANDAVALRLCCQNARAARFAVFSVKSPKNVVVSWSLNREIGRENLSRSCCLISAHVCGVKVAG